MDSKTKAFLLFVAGLLTLLVVSTVLLSRYYVGQAESNMRSHLVTEGRSLQRQVESEVALFSRELLLAVSEEIWSREQSQKLPNTALQKTDFTAIALFESKGNGWQMAWWTPRANLAPWSPEILRDLSNRLPLSQVRSDLHLFKQVAGPQKQNFFSIMLPLKPTDAGANRVAVGFFSTAVVSSWVDSQRGSVKEAAVFDADGFALSFTTPQYAGADLTPHSLVKKILKKEDLDDEEVTNLQGAAILFSAEKVNRTNLSVFVAQPRDSVMSTPLTPLLIALGFGLAIVLVFGSMMLRFWPTERPQTMPTLQDVRTHEPDSKPTGYGESSRENLLLENQGSQEERNEAYKVFGKSLSQTLSDPFSQILNHAQQARAVAHDDLLKEHLVVIEREARKSSRALENILQLSKDEEDQEKLKFNPTEALLKALVKVRSKIKEQGITLSKSLTASHFVVAPEGQLEIIFEELVRHVLVQISASSKKEIEVSGHDEAESVVFQFRFAAAEGVETDLAAHESLEFTVVKGLVYGMGGMASSDELTKGTITLTLRLPSVQTKVDRLVSVKDEVKVKINEARSLNLTADEMVPKERAQLMPTAPEENEITFVGSVIDDEFQNKKLEALLAQEMVQSREMPTASLPVVEEPSNALQLMIPSPVADSDVEVSKLEFRHLPSELKPEQPSIEIRKPKVRAKS